MIIKLIVSIFILFKVNTVLHAQVLIPLRTIAILPADVRIIGNTGQQTIEKIYQAELSMSFMFQEKVFNWFLKNNKKFKNTIEIQDTKKTNDLLFSNGMSLKQYKNLNKDSLAKMLGVDEVFFCSSFVEAGVQREDLFLLFPFVINGGSLLGGISSVGIPGGKIHKLTIILGVNNKRSFNPLWSQKYGHYNNGLNKLDDIFERILKDASHHFLNTKK